MALCSPSVCVDRKWRGSSFHALFFTLMLSFFLNTEFSRLGVWKLAEKAHPGSQLCFPCNYCSDVKHLFQLCSLFWLFMTGVDGYLLPEYTWSIISTF